MPILDKNDFKVESKLHYYMRKGAETVKGVCQYIENHKEAATIATILAIGGISAVKKLTGGAAKMRALHAERDLKDLRVYDRRIGAFLHLRRPLNNKDWKRINPRMKNGERLSDILEKMNLLK